MSPITDMSSSTVRIVEDLDRAAAFLRQRFAETEGPLSTGDLVKQGEAEADLSRFAVQLALWHLISLGQLKLTADWRVVRGPAAEHGAAPQAQPT